MPVVQQHAVARRHRGSHCRRRTAGDSPPATAQDAALRHPVEGRIVLVEQQIAAFGQRIQPSQPSRPAQTNWCPAAADATRLHIEQAARIVMVVKQRAVAGDAVKCPSRADRMRAKSPQPVPMRAR